MTIGELKQLIETLDDDLLVTVDASGIDMNPIDGQFDEGGEGIEPAFVIHCEDWV